MKKIDIFCTSQTATAICLSIDENSPSSTPSSSSSAFLLTTGGGTFDRGSAAIDRHNPIISDTKRLPKSLPPCTNYSQPPIIPKSQKNHHSKKNRKITFKENEYEKVKDGNNGVNGGNVKKSWKCTDPGDFISPPGSTRYLLRENSFSDALTSAFDPAGRGKKPSLEEICKSKDVRNTEEVLFEEKPPSSSHYPDQVVVLIVSLHCKGCERKLRKHLSKMAGVTSYYIDFAAKKVIVTGNVTPLGVLRSISKVKVAQLCSPAEISSSSPSTLNLAANSEIKNDCKGAAGA